MKKGDPPLAVLAEDRERTPEEKLLISVLTHQVKEYMAAKEIGDDFNQMRKNVRAMLHYQREKKFRWQAYMMELIDRFRDQEFDRGILYSLLEGFDHYFQVETAIYKYRRKYKLLDIGSQAEAYIFDESRDTKRDVFSFAQICKMIELDPAKFRKKLKALDRDEIKKIKEALRDEA